MLSPKMFHFYDSTCDVVDGMYSAMPLGCEEGLYYAETCGTLLYDMRRSSCVSDIVISCATFYRTITGKSAVGSILRVFEYLAEELKSHIPFFQSSASDWFDVFDSIYGNVKRIHNSVLGKKLMGVFNHVVAHAFYNKIGMNVDYVMFDKLQKKRIIPTVWNVMSFADAIVGLITFLVKAGRQAILTGSIEHFFIDEKVVTDWIETASRLRKHAEFLGNPTAVGIDIPCYVNEVRDSIKHGQSLLKVFGKGSERAILLSILLELECVEKRFTSAMIAASFRRQPVGVFIYGGSGVAKSFIAQGLFNHYCSVRGIDKERATMWTRTESDKYYSGYKSHYAGVLFDDAAKHNTNKILGIDESVGEIIDVINNIPYVTPQADVCDKGKIPMLSEWVGVTSNVNDLNADIYYRSSNAFLRRMPYRIEPVVKEAFRLPNEMKIDASKIPANVQYPDMWTFTVSKVKENGMHGEYTEFLVCDSYAELLDFMGAYYEKHIANQDKLMATVGLMGPEALCGCKRPISLCECVVDVVSQTSTLNELFPRCSSLSDPHSLRVFTIAELESSIISCEEMTAATRTYAKSLFKEIPFSDLKRSVPSGTYPNNYAEYLLTFANKAISDFTKLAPWQRYSAISDVDLPENSSSYLSFTPKKGVKCFFMLNQLKQLHETILTYAGTAFTDAELVTLENFVYIEAPHMVADGVAMPEIIRAAMDYVKYYGKALEDPGRMAVREVLLMDRSDRTRKQRFLGFACKLYFSSPCVHRAVNYLSQFRFVRWCFGNSLAFSFGKLLAGARKYDDDLKGNHPYIRQIMKWVLTAGLVAMFVTIINKFRPSQTIKCEAQLAVLPMGRDEKKNVWTTKERVITRFDYAPNKPNSMEQMMAKVKGNLLVSECSYVEGDHLKTLRTRLIALNHRTIMINNHACFDGMRMKIWLDKKTDEGIQPVVEICVSEAMIRRIPNRDIAFISTRGLPALFRDISACFPKSSATAVGPSFYLVKGVDGELRQIECAGARIGFLDNVRGGDDVNCNMWLTRPQRATEFGDCGAPLFMDTKMGPVLVGMHSAYSASINTAYATPLFLEDIPNVVFPERGVMNDKVPIAQAKLTADMKLYTDYHESGYMLVHGQVQGFNARAVATGGHTMIAHHVLASGDRFEPPIVDRLARPKMGSWAQPQRVLKEYLHPTHSMDEIVWDACIVAFKEHISANLTEQDLRDMHPVSQEVAINGYPGVANMDAIKFSTSGGHGRRGAKKQHFDELNDVGVWQTYRKPKPELQADIDRLVNDAKDGIRPHSIYTSVLKDEMLSLAKVLAGKTRCIYMCPVDFLIGMRMVTLGITRVMVRRKDVFRHSVGLNTHSEEWDDLFRAANHIPGSNWIAGDFRGYDTLLSLLISNGTSEIFMHCAEISGMFNSEELLMLETLLADCTNATVDFFGTLVTLLGGEVSGHQLTTFFNSIANTLLHMYTYVLILVEGDAGCVYEQAKKYFADVFNTTLGDDVFLKVSERVPSFNHTSIAREFERIGIVYTMADKDAQSVPYIGYEDVTFLKRSFCDHECFPGVKVACLDRLSIYKMLVYTVPSRTISAEEQLAQAMCAAVTEAFYHGKAFYTQIRDLIDEVPKTAELEMRMVEYPIPTWKQLERRFINASPKLKALLGVPEDLLEQTETSDASYCLPNDIVHQSGKSVEPSRKTTLGRSPLERIYAGVPLSSNSVLKPSSNANKGGCRQTFCNKNYRNSNYTDIQGVARSVLTQATRKISNKIYRKNKDRNWRETVFQSEELSSVQIPDTAASATELSQANVVFKNEPEGVMMDMRRQDKRDTGVIEMPQHLGDYLSRPKLIATYTWPENTANGNKAQIYPWNLFFASTDMKNKLQGFSMLSANLHLKFLVNGSPFYYGAIMAAYTPLSTSRADTAQTANNTTLLVATSQKPHVWLNNQSVSTAEMVLPFLYPYDYIDIQSASTLTGLGDIRFVQYAALQSANGVSGSNVDIQVYAWAEDVKLSGPTALAVVQSEKLSSKLSTAAYAMGKLNTTPVLGAYTSVVSESLKVASAVSKFFGYTNKPVTTDVQPIKNIPFQLSSTEIGEPLYKLSMQRDQATDLGGAQHGGPEEDELAISHFSARPSFIIDTPWATTSTPDTILFSGMVTPYQCATATGQVAYTPMGYVSRHFQYWRGSINYTFKVVRSQYHRGRVQISWDRCCTNMQQGASIGNPNTYNVVLDLDETDEVTINVPYMQPNKFIESIAADGIPANVPYSTSATPPATSWVAANGLIQVRVMNRLTSPDSAAGATLLVFVSAGEDIEFAAPRAIAAQQSTAVFGLSSATAATVQSETLSITKLAGISREPDVYKEVFGERVSSLREYLHRSSLAFTYAFNVSQNTAESIVNYSLPFKRIPPPPGVYQNGWDIVTTSSGAGQRYNFTRLHPILSIGSCFIGYKGSVNVAFNNNLPVDKTWLDSSTITRVQAGSALSNTNRRPYTFASLASATNASINNNQNNDEVQDASGVTARALTNPRTNTGLCANLPYYSTAGFQLTSFSTEYSNTTLTTPNSSDWWMWVTKYQKSAGVTTSGMMNVDCYYGTGPDFDLVFFINVPVLYSVAITVV